MRDYNNLYREIIRELRKDHKLKQSQLAEVCGVSSALVGHWETGVRDININCLVKLALYFDVSVDYILGLTNNPKKGRFG